MTFDTVIGLEVHIQLNTLSKAFCGDANIFGDEPNTHISPVTLAHPGTLPVPNLAHIVKAIKLGIALDCRINPECYFDRKHYFYPDLPKGYQITQDGQPICIGGSLEIETANGSKQIQIDHIHMEEDAGKNIHDMDDELSLIDLNRAGTPLLELVTEPVLSSGDEVYAFITALQKLLRYYDISDADMEKGSMRCDCNVSVKPIGSKVLGERCEIKNLNSRKFARDAVEYEAQRQKALIQGGGKIHQQTLQYHVEENRTLPMRDKEEAHDYRYFPDPDIVPILVSQKKLAAIKMSMPADPRALKNSIMDQYQVAPDVADHLVQSPSMVRIFDEITQKIRDGKAVAGFMVNQFIPYLGANNLDPDDHPMSTEILVEYIDLTQQNLVSPSLAHQRLWPALIQQPEKSPRALAKEMGLMMEKDQSFVDDLVAEVLEASPEQVEKYRNGKKNVLGYFMGEVMKKSVSGVDPKIVRKKLMKSLDKH